MWTYSAHFNCSHLTINLYNKQHWMFNSKTFAFLHFCNSKMWFYVELNPKTWTYQKPQSNINLLHLFCVLCANCVCLQTVRGMLENPTEAVNDSGYFDCIDSVMENSKVWHMSASQSKAIYSHIFTQSPLMLCADFGWGHGWHFP